jgi:hypothetical protein
LYEKLVSRSVVDDEGVREIVNKYARRRWEGYNVWGKDVEGNERVRSLLPPL